MFRAVGIILSVSCLTLVGCASNFKPHVKEDGKEYIYTWPVVAKGVLEDVRVTESDGTVTSLSSLSKGVGDVAGDGAVGGAITSSLGMSNVGGGLALGAVGALMDLITAATAPKVEFIVRREPEGDLINVPVANDYVHLYEENYCLQLGDPVRVVTRAGWSKGFDVFNANPNMFRDNLFSPSCDTLRAQETAKETVAG